MIGSRPASLVALLALASSCAPRPRMCEASSECAAQAPCVAGRCQPDRPNVRPAIDAARRIVVRPVDVAYLRRGEGPTGGALPAQFTLGRVPAVLLLRFSIPLSSTTNVVEAYVVMRRSGAVDDDLSPISLRATRIVEPWSGRSTSWALQPRTIETKTPTTTADPSGPWLVRVDVRDLVRRWGRHDPADHGIAVMAEGESRTGITFAFRAVGADRPSPADPYLATPAPARAGDPRSSSLPEAEPFLELYLK